MEKRWKAGDLARFLKCPQCDVNVLITDALKGCLLCNTTYAMPVGMIEHQADEAKETEQFSGFSDILLTKMGYGKMNELPEERLFVGDFLAAKSPKEFNSNGITHCVNCTRRIPNSFQNQCSYFQIKIDDIESDCKEFEFLLDAALKFVHEALKKSEKNRVFIHCAEGRSRSVTLVIAYLIEYRNFNFEDALNLVKSVRAIAKPNEAFENMLRKREERLKK